MQQIQYHGIASYKFEYQLSTGGDWTTAVTTLSTATSYAYIYSSLTAGTGYNLRVTVTDNAGNSNTGTNTANTVKPEKNPGGVIEDITTDEIIFPGNNFISTNIGKTVDYVYEVKSITVEEKFSGRSSVDVTLDNSTPWYVLSENNDYLFLVTKGAKVGLHGLTAVNNGVGLLDALCDTGYKNKNYMGISCRNLKYRDVLKYKDYVRRSSPAVPLGATKPTVFGKLDLTNNVDDILAGLTQPKRYSGTVSVGSTKHMPGAHYIAPEDRLSSSNF